MLEELDEVLAWGRFDVLEPEVGHESRGLSHWGGGRHVRIKCSVKQDNTSKSR
jgi:hypothetical protein